MVLCTYCIYLRKVVPSTSYLAKVGTLIALPRRRHGSIAVPLRYVRTDNVRSTGSYNNTSSKVRYIRTIRVRVPYRTCRNTYNFIHTVTTTTDLVLTPTASDARNISNFLRGPAGGLNGSTVFDTLANTKQTDKTIQSSVFD